MLGYRKKGDTGPWQYMCTATKVQDDGTSYILTASHCFGDELPKKGGGLLPTAENITPILSDDYAILDPTLGFDERTTNPMAVVNNVALDPSGYTDWALLSVTATPPSPSRNFDSLPALDLRKSVSLVSDPLKLEEQVYKPVKVYSVPQDSGFKEVAATGQYLGRAFSPEISGGSTQLDIVGINFSPDTKESDPCEYGGSGSNAVFSNGAITGPLSLRNNIGYGPNNEAGDPNTTTNQQSIVNRLDLEQLLGIDLSGYQTICGYSVSSPDQLNQLKKVLADPGLVIYPADTGKK